MSQMTGYYIQTITEFKNFIIFDLFCNSNAMYSMYNLAINLFKRINKVLLIVL
jgi:hypothetical protein